MLKNTLIVSILFALSYANTPVIQSGQTAVVAPFDDGHYQKGLSRSYSLDTSLTFRVVQDVTTGLQWVDNDFGAADLATAEAACSALSLGTQRWRLPSLDEILSLYDYSVASPAPAVDSTFTNISNTSRFWTSDEAWAGTHYALTFEPNNNQPTLQTAVATSSGMTYTCVSGSTPAGPVFSRDDVNDIVTDSTNNLMWQDNNASGTTTHHLLGDVVSTTWTNAIDYCENLELGGYDDWRLPNINEMRSLIDLSQSSVMIDPIFETVGDDMYSMGSIAYFSSTSSSVYPNDAAWDVHFRQNSDVVTHWTIGNKNADHFVRCCRSIAVPVEVAVPLSNTSKTLLALFLMVLGVLFLKKRGTILA